MTDNTARVYVDYMERLLPHSLLSSGLALNRGFLGRYTPSGAAPADNCPLERL